MKRDEVKTIVPGITDDQLDQLMDLHGADIERHKQMVGTLTAERDAARTQLEEVNKKLEGYDPDWKTKAEEAERSAAQQVEQLQRGWAAERVAAGLKFSSESAKRSFVADLKAKNLPLQEDQLLGAEDFVKEWRAADPAAFAPEKTPPTFTVGGHSRTMGQCAQDRCDAKYKNNPFYHSKGE